VTGPTPWDLPIEDLEQSVDRSWPDLARWGGATVLVTGGTGFLGSWLVASLIHANKSHGLDLRIDLLTRSPGRVPPSVRDSVRIVESDVTSLGAASGEYGLIIHGAASSAAQFGSGEGEPRRMSRTIVDGTDAVLGVAARSGARLLFLSSGAVYGRQSVPEVAEDDPHGPDPLDPRMAYSEAKRLAENRCAAANAADESRVTVARLFAFVGPRIALDGHFAVGNFLADAVAGRAISVAGDGSAVRSYLYAGDLPEWCWAIASRGAPGAAYNVGSAVPVTIGQLAEMVAGVVSPRLPVRVLGQPTGLPANRYVPHVGRAASELGLSVRTSLPEALEKTHRWLVEQG
jgi:nucleoside-diphosphate-sugar epimerase